MNNTFLNNLINGVSLCKKKKKKKGAAEEKDYRIPLNLFNWKLKIFFLKQYKLKRHRNFRNYGN